MCLVINKCVTAIKVSNFSDHYLRNRSTLDIGILGYIGIVQHKEHSPEILSIPPGTPCIYCMYENGTPVTSYQGGKNFDATASFPVSRILVYGLYLRSFLLR